jgi:hypothetical protein
VTVTNLNLFCLIFAKKRNLKFPVNFLFSKEINHFDWSNNENKSMTTDDNPKLIFRGSIFKQNVKIFTKMLQTMSKIGDEVMFDVQDDRIKAAVMNSSQSSQKN